MNNKLELIKNEELENVSGGRTSIIRTAVGVIAGTIICYGMYKAKEFGKDVYNSIHDSNNIGKPYTDVLKKLAVGKAAKYTKDNYGNLLQLVEDKTLNRILKFDV